MQCHIHNQTMTHRDGGKHLTFAQLTKNVLVRRFIYVPYLEIVGSILVSACNRGEHIGFGLLVGPCSSVGSKKLKLGF